MSYSKCTYVKRHWMFTFIKLELNLQIYVILAQRLKPLNISLQTVLNIQKLHFILKSITNSLGCN